MGYLTLYDIFHRYIYFKWIFTQTLYFYLFYGNVLPSLIRNNVEILKNNWWIYWGKNYFGSEDPIYCYQKILSEVQKYDVIKTHMYTSSYTQVFEYISGTKNTPKRRADTRNYGQRGEGNIRLSLKWPPFSFDFWLFLQVWIKLVLEDEHHTLFY